MSRRAVRHGDPTTTGGFVVATTATIFSDSKHVALTGDEATCGNCTGLFKIVGSATHMTWHGRSVVLEGDRVLCPCGMNMVLAGSDCNIFYDDPGGATGIVAPSSSQPTPFVSKYAAHDEQYTFCDHAGQTLSNVHYRIVTDTGKIFTGTTNGAGQTQRIVTDAATSLKIYTKEH